MMMTRSDRAAVPQPRWKTWAGIVLVFILLYLFLGGMRTMGHGLKSLGENPAFDKSQPVTVTNRPYRDIVYDIFSYADNPLIGLFVGVLATSLFQSSSFTTSFAVALVVTTPLQLHQAIFIIMGANIGTSVTNVGVSFTHIRRRQEFERAYGSAIVHDFFNVLSVIILCPIEWGVWRLTGRGLLERLSSMLGMLFHSGAPTGRKPTNFLKEAVKPVVEGAEWLLEDALGMEPVAASIVMAVLGAALLLLSLILITRTLRTLVLHRVERLFDKILFRNAATAYLVGLGLTFVVQSSSITTSLAVPLVGAGLLTIYQVFPYTLGANLGTTFTALLASFATSADTPEQAAVGVALAFSHMLFNLFGALVWYPLRRVPIEMARWWAGVASTSKRYAIVHIFAFFFVLPVLVILIEWLRR